METLRKAEKQDRAARMLEWWGRSKRQGVVDKKSLKRKGTKRSSVKSFFFFNKYAYFKMLLKYI